jgi:hypothetical protein
MKQEDVPGCGEWLELSCQGGCLTIHKILYSCRKKKESNAQQLQKVRDLCQGEETCRITPSRAFFGNDECPGVRDASMQMWTVYSCDGGNGQAEIKGPKCPIREKGCLRSYPCSRHRTCSNKGGKCRSYPVPTLEVNVTIIFTIVTIVKPTGKCDRLDLASTWPRLVFHLASNCPPLGLSTSLQGLV